MEFDEEMINRRRCFELGMELVDILHSISGIASDSNVAEALVISKRLLVIVGELRGLGVNVDSFKEGRTSFQIISDLVTSADRGECSDVERYVGEIFDYLHINSIIDRYGLGDFEKVDKEQG